MRLEDILHKTQILEVKHPELNPEIRNIATDSRKIDKNGLFIARQGIGSDGHQYIDQAINHGAKVVVYDKPLESYHAHVVYVRLADTIKDTPQMLNNFYEHPSENISLIGITGTNGKTSTANYVYQLVNALGGKCGLISTVDIRFGDTIRSSTHTTPDIGEMYRLIFEMIESDCDTVVMEVSSHALHQGRVQGLEFSQAVFTNISHDHLDYHGNFQEYLDSKKILFDHLSKNAIAIINKDDKRATYLLQNSAAQALFYGLRSLADYQAKVLESQAMFNVIEVNGFEMVLPLIGEFNVYNALAAFAVCDQLGYDWNKILEKGSLLKAVGGRMEYILSSDQKIAVVDYAHTPDALEKVLEALRNQSPKKVKIICVVGCGGDRDKAKRPLMAQISYHKSDVSILTSDNPRSEEPEDILNEMLNGLTNQQQKEVFSIVNRREAIKLAVQMAHPHDVILVAGKGHEKYQEIKGVKHPFDDLEILKTFMS